MLSHISCHCHIRAVDIWAIGCLVIEMLTADPLFPGDSDIDQLFQIIKCFGKYFIINISIWNFYLQINSGIFTSFEK